jgi:hypothetical protein
LTHFKQTTAFKVSVIISVKEIINIQDPNWGFTLKYSFILQFFVGDTKINARAQRVFKFIYLKIKGKTRSNSNLQTSWGRLINVAKIRRGGLNESANRVFHDSTQTFPWPALFSKHHRVSRHGIAQSLQLLTTGWTVLGSNPGVSEISCTRRNRPRGPTQLSVQWVLVLFPGGKAAGAWG